MTYLDTPDELPLNPTVKDLINLLKKYPEDTPVKSQDGGGFMSNVCVYVNNIDEWRKGILFIESDAE